MTHPQLENALKALSPSYTLIVGKFARFGRNVRDLAELLEELEHCGIFFESLAEGIDTSKSVRNPTNNDLPIYWIRYNGQTLVEARSK